MRQMQKKWVALELLACICLTMHRDEHWGTDRIGKFIGLVDKLRKDVGENPDAFAEMLKDVTGVDTWEEK